MNGKKLTCLFAIIALLTTTTAQAGFVADWSHYWKDKGASTYDAQEAAISKYRDFYDYAKEWASQDGSCDELCGWLNSVVVVPALDIRDLINQYPTYYKSMHDSVANDGLTGNNFIKAFSWAKDAFGRLSVLVNPSTKTVELYKALVKSILRSQLRMGWITVDDFQKGTAWTDVSVDFTVSLLRLIMMTSSSIKNVSDFYKDSGGHLSAFAKYWKISNPGSPMRKLSYHHLMVTKDLIYSAVKNTYSIAGASEDYKKQMNKLLDSIFQ